MTPIQDSIVGSRVIEVAYSSNPQADPLGNFTSTDAMQIQLGTGSRIVEIPYSSS